MPEPLPPPQVDQQSFQSNLPENMLGNAPGPSKLARPIPALSPPPPVVAQTDQQSFPSNLPEKLLGDIVIASSVTAAIAPFLTVVDKALVQRSVGSHTILSSILSSAAGMVRHPVAYFKSPTFLWMWATYASTYSAANSLRTLTEHQEYVKARHEEAAVVSTSSTSSSTSKKANNSNNNTTATLFLGTTLVNTSASLVKDRAYARMFGNATAGLSVPAISYALWITRDFTVIGSSFILPGHVAPMLQSNSSLDEKQAVRIAQVATPMVAQLIAGPLHFVGLDCYNRNLSHMAFREQVMERTKFLAAGFNEVVAARMIRILPGYGVGGVWNTSLRGQWRDVLIRRQIQTIVAATTMVADPSRQEVSDLVALIRAKSQSEESSWEDDVFGN
jgi:hypothetical protein